MSEHTLKPCPFCGGKAEVRHYSQNICFVQCQNCLCGSNGWDSPDKAIHHWNKRFSLWIRMKKFLGMKLMKLLKILD